jgi:hypothetical protein
MDTLGSHCEALESILPPEVAVIISAVLKGFEEALKECYFPPWLASASYEALAFSFCHYRRRSCGGKKLTIVRRRSVHTVRASTLHAPSL